MYFFLAVMNSIGIKIYLQFLATNIQTQEMLAAVKYAQNSAACFWQLLQLASRC
jgi:hypothetical protein